MTTIAILVCVLCAAFIVLAFRHVYIHEKKDLGTFKRLLKNPKTKKRKKS